MLCLIDLALGKSWYIKQLTGPANLTGVWVSKLEDSQTHGLYGLIVLRACAARTAEQRLLVGRRQQQQLSAAAAAPAHKQALLLLVLLKSGINVHAC